MSKKFKIESPDGGGGTSIEIVGLDSIFFDMLDCERTIGKYERFTEHVVLSCTMPEVPRLAMHDDELNGTPLEGGYEAVQKLLVRYRKITSWMRANGIDVNSIVGDNAGKTKS